MEVLEEKERGIWDFVLKQITEEECTYQYHELWWVMCMLACYLSGIIVVTTGSCTWGAACRFLHPGINDKGMQNNSVSMNITSTSRFSAPTGAFCCAHNSISVCCNVGLHTVTTKVVLATKASLAVAILRLDITQTSSPDSIFFPISSPGVDP